MNDTNILMAAQTPIFCTVGPGFGSGDDTVLISGRRASARSDRTAMLSADEASADRIISDRKERSRSWSAIAEASTRRCTERPARMSSMWSVSSK